MPRTLSACTHVVLVLLTNLIAVIPSTTASSRQLIQGAANITSDISIIPTTDAWPYTLGLAVCKDNVPQKIICGATLIHPSVVLTANHCVLSKGAAIPTANICIIQGATNMTDALSNPSKYTVITASEVASHPNYKHVTDMGEFHLTGDVTLLFLNESINNPLGNESWLPSKTSNPGYVLLPNPNQYWDRFHMTAFTVAIGWGLTENANISAAVEGGEKDMQRLDEKRVIFQIAMSPNECKNVDKFYGMQNLQNDTLCGAWFGAFESLFNGQKAQITASICQGDSGGPLVVPSTILDAFGFQGDVQIGIVSAGPPCPYNGTTDDKAWPAEYVALSQYVPWIHEQMKLRGRTPLKVATNPLKRAYIGDACVGKDCYSENVMSGGKIPTVAAANSARGSTFIMTVGFLLLSIIMT